MPKGLASSYKASFCRSKLQFLLICSTAILTVCKGAGTQLEGRFLPVKLATFAPFPSTAVPLMSKILVPGNKASFCFARLQPLPFFTTAIWPVNNVVKGTGIQLQSRLLSFKMKSFAISPSAAMLSVDTLAFAFCLSYCDLTGSHYQFYISLFEAVMCNAFHRPTNLSLCCQVVSQCFNGRQSVQCSLQMLSCH